MTSDLVLTFYQEVFENWVLDDSQIVGFENGIFDHPVVSPNFIKHSSCRNLSVDSKIRWLNVFEHLEEKECLNHQGFKKKQSCSFLFYLKPFETKCPRFQLQIHESLPKALVQPYKEKTSLYSPGLEVEVLDKIEKVFEASKGKVRRCLAFAEGGKLVGAVTQVSSSNVSMLLNAWIDPSYRNQHIMKSMVGHLVTLSFLMGQKLVFAWTFNPVIKSQGDEQKSLHIYFRD